MPLNVRPANEGVDDLPVWPICATQLPSLREAAAYLIHLLTGSNLCLMGQLVVI